MTSDASQDRRKYRRIQAPVFCRPARVGVVRRAIDVSLGGVRVYSDDELETGEELKLEMFVDGGEAVTFTCRVRWIERLAAGAPARFDVGLAFVDVGAEARRALLGVLGPPDDGG